MYTPPGDTKILYACVFMAELYQQEAEVIRSNETEMFATWHKAISKAVNLRDYVGLCS